MGMRSDAWDGRSKAGQHGEAATGWPPVTLAKQQCSVILRICSGSEVQG
jgi:hypothetical protein